MFELYSSIRTNGKDIPQKLHWAKLVTQVEDAKEKNAGLAAQKEDLTGKQIRLNAKLDELTSENRFSSSLGLILNTSFS